MTIIEVKQLGLSTGQFVKVRRIKKINVKYIGIE